ncbi:VTC domain-containing protein [Sanguibacter gelidistatuariae]|uniref:VTC domain-containing protein n=1 Tax=Sanguibacter gelidistatuariae TaxID=1814289 RepID=A0A1G6RV89_9MICO|nr:polyphosphate polymerase domain-containing protein [Sanguibacter gelidistatuariae]SDD08478.1 VTC domain-containing protein [Sanguibacter gelidistatuariae]
MTAGLAATSGMPTVQGTDALVAGFTPVTLDEIQERADLQTRVDRKYVVPGHLFAELLEAHPDLGVLEIAGRRRFGYESVYFDTPDLVSYRGAAHGRRRRFKVRTRTYTDAGDCVFEVKVKGGRGETVKERLPYGLGDAETITPQARAFVADVLHEALPDAEGLVRSLSPTLVTMYDRTTFVDAAAGTRLTCDTTLRCTTPDDDASVALDDQVLLESKSPGAPTAIDRWLWSRGHRPDQISKYCVGLAALDAELPSNKWHRTLVRHFG